MRGALEICFWVCAGLIFYTQLGYFLLLWVIAALRKPPRAALVEGTRKGEDRTLPLVSLIVAAHNEESVIEQKVANVRELDWPRERLELIVACDGCSDRTATLAKAAGADLVLELPRCGKVRAQDEAVAQARGAILAFSDANSSWDRAALRLLLGALADERTGYACGQVRYSAGDPDATSQEGVYWRYELALRALESRLCSITAGNGAIYALPRKAYMIVDPIMGHDLALPYRMLKRGLRARYVAEAVAVEKMVPTIEGELARKRRMMAHTWPILLRGGMLCPRGYPPGYYLMIISHRLLRYATPFLHLIAFGANLAAVALGAGPLLIATLCLQGATLLAAALGDRVSRRPLLIARHYLLSTAAIALGLFDWLAHGTQPGWSQAEGTR
jgi:cellulose synthase/poly-beta-1,6-N-acetylglucosamine synthase-like glycosyltransferase